MLQVNFIRLFFMQTLIFLQQPHGDVDKHCDLWFYLSPIVTATKKARSQQSAPVGLMVSASVWERPPVNLVVNTGKHSQ